jgi:hypothetical protein
LFLRITEKKKEKRKNARGHFVAVGGQPKVLYFLSFHLFRHIFYLFQPRVSRPGK